MKFIKDCFIELFTDPGTYALLLFGLVIFYQEMWAGQLW